MKYKFNKFAGILFVFLLLAICTAPVLADTGPQDGTTVTLRINWAQDTSQDRPEAVYVELYRTVGDSEIVMDAKKLTATDNWQAVFKNLPGQTYEYAFHVTGADPETALYAYHFNETGAGTANRSFTYTYGHGSTAMDVVVKWNDNADSAKKRPQKISVDLMNLTTGEQERTIVMSAQDNETGTGEWTAEVTGLEDDPANYYIVETDLPLGYSYMVTRGTKSSTYISTNTYAPGSTVMSQNTSTNAANAVAGAAAALTYKGTLTAKGVLGNDWLNAALLVSIAGISTLAIMRHRAMVRRKNRR